MSNKMSYPQFKAVYSAYCEEMRKVLFIDNNDLHGWSEEEFFNMFDAEYSKTHQQFINEYNEIYNEETYDIAIQAPTTIQ